MRKDGFALLVVLGLALTVGLAAGLVAVRLGMEAEGSRREGEAAVARVALQGELAELGSFLAGPVREAVRAELGPGRPNRPYSYTPAELLALREGLQAAVDQIACPRFRIHLSPVACGERLEGLPAPGRVEGPERTGGPAAIQRYRLPFVAVARGTHREAVQEGRWVGAYEFEVGAALPSRYALWVDNAYAPGGGLYFLEEEMVLEGRVHIGGQLGVAGRPWFAGPVTSGSCPAIGADGGCVGPPEPGLYFRGTGFVPLTPPKPQAGRAGGAFAPDPSGGVVHPALARGA